ncbi:GH25 family lysozyme, partial [Microbispora sp. NPDC049125]|uniref:GH25 family lysozyme n=1 Tax=Microbispora sp. NPDC049125 TaxID=3154929 RepID=UPI003467277B
MLGRLRVVNTSRLFDSHRRKGRGAPVTAAFRSTAVGVAAAVMVAVTAAPAAAVPSGYSVGGTDVSNHDGTINWSQTAAKGVKFGWAKATEGLDFVDGQFNANYHGAKDNGVYIGAYAFGRPDKGVNTGRAQADFLIDHAQYVNDGKTLPLQLDIEWPWWTTSAPVYPCYGLTPSQMVTWIRDFVNEVKARTGREAAIYTNANWWNNCTGNNTSFSANPLETARYGDSPGTLPAGWSRPTAWQYAGSSSTLPGSPTVFNGSADDLAAFARGSGASTPSPVSGSPAVVHEGFVSMFTRSAGDGHIQEAYLPKIGSSWYTQDLSSGAGIPASATKPVAIVHEGYTSVFTVNASDGHLQETYLPKIGSAWYTQDLSSTAGTPASADVTPAVVVHEGYTSVFTVNAADGHLQETYLPKIGSAWYTQDISGTAGTPASADVTPAVVVHEGYTSVFTVNASGGHLQETYLPKIGSAWYTQDISGTAGTPASADVTPAVVVHEGYTSVFTVNASGGHLQETYLPKIGSAWYTQDISGTAGTPAVTGTPAVVVHEGYTSVFTVNASGGHLQ